MPGSWECGTLNASYRIWAGGGPLGPTNTMPTRVHVTPRLQASFLDVDPLELERHAVRRSMLAANAFYLLHPLTVLGMAFMGGRHAVSK